MTLTRKMLHVGATALMLSTVASVTTFVSADYAYAERGGNGNGNGSSNSRANRGDNAPSSNRGGNGNGRGAIASELKWLNAANANQNALDNASPNSRPGQLKIFQTDYAAAQEAIAAAETALATAQSDLTDATAIRDLLLAMDPLAYVPTETYPTYDLALAAAENNVSFYSGAVATEQTKLDTATAAADTAVTTLTDGRELSEAAFAELLAMLGL